MADKLADWICIKSDPSPIVPWEDSWDLLCLIPSLEVVEIASYELHDGKLYADKDLYAVRYFIGDDEGNIDGDDIEFFEDVGEAREFLNGMLAEAA